MATIIVAVIVFGLMSGIIYKKFKQYQLGESHCGCGCSGCSTSKSCHSKNK